MHPFLFVTTDLAEVHREGRAYAKSRCFDAVQCASLIAPYVLRAAVAVIVG
jgi:hypothetical protein